MSRFPVIFRYAGVRFWVILCPLWELGLRCRRLTGACAPDPDGVSTFRTRETRTGPGSGSRSALLRPGPLRTGQARFPGISAQASPKAHGWAEGPGPCARPLLSRRAQWACMSRSAAVSSGVPRPASTVIAWRRIAVRVTLTHCSHS